MQVAWNTDPSWAAGVAHHQGAMPSMRRATLQGRRTSWTVWLELGQSNKHDRCLCHINAGRSRKQIPRDSEDQTFFGGTYSISITNQTLQKCWNLVVQSNLSVYRFHRRLTGASTLTRRKKGRWMRWSRIAPSQMSVVTQCSCHRLVTKSRSKSTLSNNKFGDCVLSSCSTRVSLLGSWLLLLNPSILKPCCWAKYSAMACLPEHMPFQTLLVHVFSFLLAYCGTVLTSTQTNKHFEMIGNIVTAENSSVGRVLWE